MEWSVLAVSETKEPIATAQAEKPSPALRITSVIVLLGLVGIVLWATGAVRVAHITSASMEPTILKDDFILVRIDAYRNHAPVHGDLMVFSYADETDLYVKRVIGEPGDEIIVASGHVWRNGQWLNEPYASGGRVRERPLGWRLENDEFLVLGDNRDHSEDSRDFGPVPRERVKGKASAVIWPLSRRGPLP